MQFVIDTAVTMAWCFPDEATAGSDALLERLREDQAVVPGLWQLEVANVLLVAERRGRVTEALGARFLSLLGRLPILVDPAPADPSALVAAGRRHGLSAYDAEYLLLAERHGLSLATTDQKLAAACRSAGLDLITP